MQVRLESEEQMSSRRQKQKRKRGRPAGPKVGKPEQAAREAAEDLAAREQEWLERLTNDPASLARVEREVHEQMREHADRFMAGLLAEASEQSAMAKHVAHTLDTAEVQLGAVEKKDAR